MSVLHPSSIRSFFTFRPRHHVLPNVFSSKRETALLPNDGVLPTAGVFTECFEEKFLLNGVLLPNSAHRSVSFMYQFFVLTDGSSVILSSNYSTVKCFQYILQKSIAWTKNYVYMHEHILTKYSRPC
jgi:hypothetical protein